MLATRSKAYLYFERELAKPEKQRKKSALRKFLVFLSYNIKNGETLKNLIIITL